jgi:hypothetical protein
MRTIPFDVGVLLFGTLTPMCCGLLEAEPYLQPLSFERYLAPDVAGLLIGFASLIYFNLFRVTGSFIKFSIEYWLAGTTCYLLLTWIAIGLSLSRRQGLFSMESWGFELSMLFPRVTLLLGVGAGIIIFGYVVTKYSE